jgi:hypothetical protein
MLTAQSHRFVSAFIVLIVLAPLGSAHAQQYQPTRSDAAPSVYGPPVAVSPSPIRVAGRERIQRSAGAVVVAPSGGATEDELAEARAAAAARGARYAWSASRGEYVPYGSSAAAEEAVGAGGAAGEAAAGEAIAGEAAAEELLFIFF